MSVLALRKNAQMPDLTHRLEGSGDLQFRPHHSSLRRLVGKPCSWRLEQSGHALAMLWLVRSEWTFFRLLHGTYSTYWMPHTLCKDCTGRILRQLIEMLNPLWCSTQQHWHPNMAAYSFCAHCEACCSPLRRRKAPPPGMTLAKRERVYE